jgi:hypothetical protein
MSAMTRNLEPGEERRKAGRSEMVVGESLAMHLNSGVPVLQIVGMWSEATERLLHSTVKRLMAAGHYDIIVNLANITSYAGIERNLIDGLGGLASTLRSRCGRLDVVASVEQIREGLVRQAHSCWRWATTEEEAVCRVKGLTNGVCGPVSIVKARLNEGV